MTSELNFLWSFLIYLKCFRPERFNMRLYTLDKRSFLLVFMAFFACFALGIFIGLAGEFSFSWKFVYHLEPWHFRTIFVLGPEITLTREIDASKLANSSSENFLANGPFIVQTTLLGSYSRQLWLFAKYQIENTESNYDLQSLIVPRISNKNFQFRWNFWYDFWS